MKNIATSVIFVLGLSTLCHGQNTYTYSQPKELGDGWETNNLKSQKIDTAGIYQLFDQIQNGKNKVHSVLLIRNGQLIIEEYFNGHSANKPHDLRSTTKSITSILMGIAVDKGFIENIDDPISKYLIVRCQTKILTRARRKLPSNTF